MNKIGTLLGEGVSADVFQGEDGYFSKMELWGLDKNGDEFETNFESGKFASLKELLSGDRDGLMYLPIGESKPDPEWVKRRSKISQTAYQKLKAVYDSRSQES